MCQNLEILEQWVEAVTKFSSEYDSSGWSANMVVGAPRVYPSHGDNQGAWAQGTCDNQQFIEVSFAKTVYIEQVDIYETFNPGAVIRIRAQGVGGRWTTLWETDKPDRKAVSQIFSPTLTVRKFKSKQIRLDMDCTAASAPTWCELDAIKLIGKTLLLDKPPLPSALGESLKVLVDSPNFSDVQFIVEGQRVHGHRNILTVRWPYFETEFRNRYEQPIELEDMSLVAFMGVLHYLYTNNIQPDVTASNLVKIIRAATEFELPELVTLCNCYLASQLCTDNVLQILQDVSVAPPLDSTRTICLEYCCENFLAVTQSASFVDLPQQLMVEVTQVAAAAMCI